MENITVGQIAIVLAFIVTMWGSVDSLGKKITKIFNDSLDKKLKPLNDKIDKIDMQSTKNFLVAQIQDIEVGQPMNETTKQRFYEEFQHYETDLKGNSYIKQKVEKLQKDGRI